MGLDWASMELKWQRKWAEAKVFESDPDPKKEKYFVTVAYPYPNSPQHIGHGRTYTLADVHARYMRMKGFNVLFPMAFHYTGTPILAMSKRIREGDKELIETFKSIYGVPEEKLREFVEPINIARYFHEEIKRGMIRMGYSIDWRREFTTIDPQYSQFIRWQFSKLREGGYITQGSHPVGWCPQCGNPVGQHDTKGDVEPEIERFIVIKFKLQDGEAFLPTATLRPETVFGVTNIWVNPKVEYVKVSVDGEYWIISPQAADKLKYIKGKIEVLEKVSGNSLIGKLAENPINGKKILVLPANFVDPDNATGVVMSVPGHAPYDYIALEDLKRREDEVRSFGLNVKEVKSIKPISIITVSGYSDIPAADLVSKLGITSQLDPKLEKATRTLYMHEYQFGKMRENTDKYSGLAVAEARERITGDLIDSGLGDVMYELANKPVFCRCGAKVVVKIFKDQWFIDYGKPEWKNLARECIERMEILPPEMRKEFWNVIEWLHEKACARRSGLGTKLPWDERWIIESLSDSVIYMAYYTIAKIIKQYKISAENLTSSVFDYIFLGKGDAKEISVDSGIDEEALRKMREEFTYFYPLDSRHSGRDLVPNHLTFMIFIHTAIFPKELWPRQIVVNGSVLMEGQKMSKSLGNIIPLVKGISMFGADPLRLTVLGTADLLQDVDFSFSVAKSMRERLERLYGFVCKVANMKTEESGEVDHMGRWMLSRLQRHIAEATEAMDKLMVRRAINTALYLMDRDLQWYLHRIRADTRTEDIPPNAVPVIRRVLDAQIRMLAPAIPHICEELWEILGGEEFVSTASWPTPDESLVDEEAEEFEAYLISCIEDAQSIIKVLKKAPRKITYYTASTWKWRVYMNLLTEALESKLEVSNAIKLAKEEVGRLDREIVDFVKKTVDELNRTPAENKERRTKFDWKREKEFLERNLDFIARELNAEVKVYSEEDPTIYDPEKRANLARPFRPAIYIEH
ncbi:leucine--tRNA ligase [Candidatus Bathyarchaeota archaeon]|nr:leucine--tRNA ligase [Candidatus Bathyarchaeota archaeon]